MGSLDQPSNVFRFGTFEMDVASRQLRKSGYRVKVSGQPLEVLAVLLERSGEVVTREELRVHLWPGNTHVEFEPNLNKVVNRLRGALGDSPERPLFLETIPGRGYRFIAPVERVESPAGNHLDAHALPTIVAPAAAGRGGWRLAAALLLALAAALAWFVFHKGSPAPQSFRSVPLSSYAGRETSASFSPDGTAVAFVWDGAEQDNIDIYTLSIGASKAVRLTSNASKEYSPAWSPDGNWIAFLRELDADRASVLVMSPDGKSVRPLATLHSQPPVYAAFSIPRGTLAWSADSQFVVAPDSESQEGPFALFALSLASGDLRRITTPPPQTLGDFAPSLSPDGRGLAFIRGGGHQTGKEIHVLEVTPDLTARGSARRIGGLSQPWIDSFDWTADGRELVFSAAQSIDGGRTLYRVPVARSGNPEPLLGFGPDCTYPAVSRHGARLAYTRQDSRMSSIWRIRLSAPGVASGSPERLTASTSTNMAADLSPDGKRIVFRSAALRERPQSGLPAPAVPALAR